MATFFPSMRVGVLVGLIGVLLVLPAVAVDDVRGLAVSQAEAYDDVQGLESAASGVSAGCDPAEILRAPERKALLNKLRISIAGRQVLSDFNEQYGSFKNLVIQWDSVSYSKVAPLEGVAAGRGVRSPASVVPRNGFLGEVICVHLTRTLPDIEHVADLVHELTHATRLEMRVLKGDVADAEEFVRARLTGAGGEADAFSVECRVKRELLGFWDELCAPYASADENGGFNTRRVVDDLYNGRLSASLTGESYPVMLSRQYRALKRKRISAVENKAGIH